MKHKGLKTVTAGIVALMLTACNEHIHQYQKSVSRAVWNSHQCMINYTCQICGKTEDQLLTDDHQYEKAIIYPTYDEEGYTLCTCKICGKQLKTDPVPKRERPANDIDSAEIEGIAESYGFTGKAIEPDFTVILHGTELIPNQDYQAAWEHNTECGTAELTVTGIGKYHNKLVKQFAIVRKGWEEKDGNRYYYDGKYVRGVYEIENKQYFFDENGIMQTGWQEINGSYYCFDRIDGSMIQNDQVDGIKVDATGKAEHSKYNVYKITTMMTAHRIMLEQTLPTDTMEEKRLKLFKWEMYEHNYHRWRLLSKIYKSSPDWEITFANDIFERNSGCCVADSCACAFLFREIGYTDIYICHDTSHCWFTVGGKLYDPLFAEAKSFQDNYNAEYTDYRKWPVGRRRVDGVSTDVKSAK